MTTASSSSLPTRRECRKEEWEARTALGSEVEVWVISNDSFAFAKANQRSSGLKFGFEISIQIFSDF